MRPHGSQNELERRRILAVHRIMEGLPPDAVAEFLGVDRSSVWRWWSTFQEFGVRGLRARPIAGRPLKLSPTQEKIIRRWMREPPTQLGFSTDLWTAPRLSYLIEQEFEIHMHANYLSSWLRQRNYTPQLPKRSYREADPRVIARWLTRDWPRIKKKAKKIEAFLAFVDESGLLMAPLLRRSWSLRGHRPNFPQQGGKREKVSIAAAILLSPTQDRLEVFYKTLVNDYFDNFYSALFIEALLKDLGKAKVILVWDGGPMHKGDPINQLRQIFRGRLFLEKFPPYAPKLNPVESLWSWLKYGRLCNYAALNAKELNHKAIHELDPIRTDQHLLHAIWNESELPMPVALLF